MITKHEWRWVMGWADWLAVAINVVTLFLLAAAFAGFFSGCAGPEPPAPIQAYRAEYGFTP